MERAVPCLPADDITVAKDFYVNKLGFRLTFEEVQPDGKSGIMGVARGTIELTIDAPMSGHGRNACATLHVADADNYYQEWVTRVSIKNAPRDEYWGARTFGFEDPSGNTIFVIGPPREAA
jgi:catechol 2,3-dioxygenase-like lactoylglutathione lyase family enzyme